VRLNPHEWGARDAPLVVCLHGVTSHGGRFRRLAETLAPRYRVLALDLRGHGRSEYEPPWSLATHVDDVLETVGEERATWIGHSFGGRIIAELAARRPELVERAVLLDPALQVLPHVAFDMAEHERADASYASVDEAVQARYDSGRVLIAPRELVHEDEESHLEADREGRLRYRYNKGAVIAAWSEMATRPPEPARIPTLIVLGAESWLFLDEQVEAYRAALGDLLRVVTVPGGHTVMWDALAETSQALEAFLAT
jgi:lipase